MIRRLSAIFVLAVALLSPRAGAETDKEVAARKNALDVAGAFSNDGFKLRDGHWCGTIEPGKPQLVQVSLYAGNEYWFSVGATAEAKKLAVSVYDEAGKPLLFDPWSQGGTAAAGFAPEASGPYYVKIEALEGTPATFCLLYSYK
jgi:hypothetical protein